MSENLSQMIEKKGTFALNEAANHPLSNAFESGIDSFLESADDEQLLATVAFREPVKIARLVLTTLNDGRAPKTVKLFVNRPNLDFNDAEADKPTQTFFLGDEAVEDHGDTNKPKPVQYLVSDDGKSKSAELVLHYVRFQKVSELTVFVEDNLGDEETSVLARIELLSGEKTVKHVEFAASEAAFDALLAAAGEQTLFVDFTAGWCGPCKRIAPVFQTLADATPSARFVKVDVDANKAVATRYGVTAMPTFMAFKAGQKVAEMRGADAAALETFINDNK